MATSAPTPAQTSAATCSRCSSDPCICHTFIGGSEAFELLSERQYGRGCIRQLAYRKERVEPDFPEPRSRKQLGLFQRGHRLEEIAAELYSQKTGRHLLHKKGLRRNPENPGAGVHTDRFIVAHDASGTGDAEIKTHDEGPFLHIRKDGLPVGHSLQLQWSLWITRHKWGSFIVLGVFQELPLIFEDQLADPEIFEIFARKNDEFWNFMARNELPPPPFPADDVRCKLCPWRLSCRGEAALDEDELLLLKHEKKTPLQIVNDPELAELVEDYADTRADMKLLDDDSDEHPGQLQVITRRIKELMADIPGALVGGEWRVYLGEGTWKGFDVKRFRQEQPKLYEKYVLRKQTAKRLTVNPINPAKRERDGTGTE